MIRLGSSLLLALLLALPCVEMLAHALTRAHVATAADFRAAAAFVRAQLRERDLIEAAPGWADPLLREVLGDRIDLEMAGRSDNAAYERLWALSIRGARPRGAPAGAPELSRRFGRVSVLRWSLGASHVLYDFTRNVTSASVSVGALGRERACKYRHFPPPRGGGLGFGVLPPVERFGCEGGSQFGWVAPLVMEDLAIEPRYCVFQAPFDREPVRVRFDDVPLGDRIVFYGGVYYEHERMREGGPIAVRIASGARELGRMLHRDGDGWKRLELASPGGRGELTIEVSADNPERRSFCWAASARAGTERAAR